MTLPPDQIATISYRMSNLEQRVQQLQNQLLLYVPMRENELQLNAIQLSVQRIERDIQEIKEQITESANKLAQQDKDARDLQIRVLWFVVSTVIGVLIAYLLAYLTHFIH